MATDPYHHAAWPTIRPVILDRDNHTCQIDSDTCTVTADCVDHIIPWQEGGAWFDHDNLRAACSRCNTSRGASRMHAMAKLNRQPAATPSRDW